MRCLHQRQFRIFQETTHRRLQEDACRNVVAVEHGNQLTLRQLHGVVEVTGFGVIVVVTRDVPDANVCGKNSKLAAFAVIQQVDIHLIARIINALRRQHRITHHIQWFVIGRNIDIHRRPLGHIIRQRHNFAF